MRSRTTIFPKTKLVEKESSPFSRYIYGAMEYHKRSFQRLIMFFTSHLMTEDVQTTMACWTTCKIAQPIEPIMPAVCTFLPCLCLTSKSHHLKLFHIFAICLSSRHDKRYQVLEKLLLVFLLNINVPSFFSFTLKTETEKAELSTPWANNLDIFLRLAYILPR